MNTAIGWLLGLVLMLCVPASSRAAELLLDDLVRGYFGRDGAGREGVGQGQTAQLVVPLGDADRLRLEVNDGG